MTMLTKEQALRMLMLDDLLPASQIVTDPIELLAYEVDAGMDRGQPTGVVFPQNAEEVSRVVRWAAANETPLVARGAGTGLSGGAVTEQGGIVLQFSRMNAITQISTAGRYAVVQPGVVNQTLDGLVKTKGLYYPPDPASGRSATIGGNIAENSGGPHCFKYGVTTNYVSGLEVVLADGRRIRLGGAALDYPEYDFAGLVTGSEGTLAIVTESNLRLSGNPPAVKTLMAAFDSVETAGAAVSAVIAQGLVPATMEMMDQRIMQIIEQFTQAGLPIHAGAALIIEADGYPDSVGSQIGEIETILRDNGASDLRVAKSEQERATIWYGRKSAVGAMTRLAPAYYLVDVTVPRSKLAAMLGGVNRICAALDLRVGYVFHAGDGNLHPLILIDDPKDPALMERVHKAGQQIVELCVSFDGSITGEHGVGIEKRAYMPLMYTSDEIDVMRDVKAVFDPHNVFNPGKILPPRCDEQRMNGQQPSGQAAAAESDSGQVSIDQVITPTSAEEAAAQLRGLTLQGKRVRICGGSPAADDLPSTDVMLSTERLCGIHTYARDDLYVTVGAGTSLTALQAELAHDRMWVPMVAPQPEATIGGIVSTNTNAPMRMRYSGLRDLVMATTVALPDGRVIRAGRPVVKNVAGYDLPKVFIGAYGTLGLLVDVTLKLAPLPRAQTSLVLPVSNVQQGLDFGAKLLPHCLIASALLLCDAQAVRDVDLSAPYALIYTAEGMESDVAAELQQARQILEAAGATDMREIAGLSGSKRWANWLRAATDAAPNETSTLTMRAGVAPDSLPSLIRDLIVVSDANQEQAFVADLANGLLYLHGTIDPAAVGRRAESVGGYGMVIAPTAEAPAWRYTPQSLDLMRDLQSHWNPGGLLNPGAFPADISAG